MQLQNGFETNVASIQPENEFLNTKLQKTSFKKRLLSTSRKYIQNMYSTYIRPAFLKSWLVIKMTRGPKIIESKSADSGFFLDFYY